MSWQPDPRGLEEVLGMLRDSSSSDSNVQKVVAQVSWSNLQVDAHVPWLGDSKVWARGGCDADFCSLSSFV